ncbi:MAG: hypothetical protein EKK29_08345 [Hyphomicrobiales bacterium]|nr:MAG: hypothetical protein EKK29_08345 [Hyphomicrobiales bacterium]
MNSKRHYEHHITDCDPDSNLAFFIECTMLREALPHIKFSLVPVTVPANASPAIRAFYEKHKLELSARYERARVSIKREFSDWGLPENSLQSPQVESFIDEHIRSVNAARYLVENLAFRKSTATLLEDGSYARPFCNRVIFSLWAVLRGEGKGFTDTANYLNEGSRKPGITRDHVRRAVLAHAKVAEREAASESLMFVGYALPDYLNARAVRHMLDQAKKSPRLKGLKGSALARGIAANYDFQEKFDRALQLGNGS